MPDDQAYVQAPKTELPKEKKKELVPSVEQQVKKWTNRIIAARKHFEADMNRMKNNMEFVAGIQWAEQVDLLDDRYTANLVLREINQGVASLYARNPKAVARRRQRMDSTIWDGKPETLMQAAQTLQTGVPNPMAFLVIQDFIQTRTQEQLIDKLAKTLETAYQIQIDRQEPDFKLQMKALVRRIKVCGVAFVRACFKRESRLLLTPSQTGTDIDVRMKQIKKIVEDYEEKKFDDSSSQVEQLKMLVNSVSYSMSNPSEARESIEKLVFDFPPSTSIIVDPHCRMWKGLLGAKWFAQEYILPMDEVKAFFECPDLSTGPDSAKTYSSSGESTPPNPAVESSGGTPVEQHVCVWEVFDKSTKSRFFICDGYKNYLLEPEEPRPCVQRFWPLIAVTFNDIETEPGLKVSIYPPSDVDMLRSPQKEWNRSRQALREHRKANKPKYAHAPGALTDEDKEELRHPSPTAATYELRALGPNQKVGDVLQPIPSIPIDPMLYATEPLERDFQLATGAQQAVMGPITKKGTATEATISEQSRLSSTSSNVDDLDDLLTEMARVGGEMMLREMSQETIKRDVGPGAVWPEGNREEYVDRVYLEIQAATTGRPNKGLEIANFERLAPLLLQAGANPVFLVREGVKRLDDRLDVNEAFPIIPQMMAPPSGGPPNGAPAPGQVAGPPSPQAVPNETSAGPPVPLAGGTDAANAS